LQAHPGLLSEKCRRGWRSRRNDWRARRLRASDCLWRAQRSHRTLDQLLYAVVRAGVSRIDLDARLHSPDGTGRCWPGTREASAAAGISGNPQPGPCRCLVWSGAYRLASRGQEVLGYDGPRHCTAQSLGVDPRVASVIRGLAGVVGGRGEAAIGWVQFYDRSTVLACSLARHLWCRAAYLLLFHGADLRWPPVDDARNLVADDSGRGHRLRGAESEHAVFSVPRIGSAVRVRRGQFRFVDVQHLVLLPTL